MRLCDGHLARITFGAVKSQRRWLNGHPYHVPQFISCNCWICHRTGWRDEYTIFKARGNTVIPKGQDKSNRLDLTWPRNQMIRLKSWTSIKLYVCLHTWHIFLVVRYQVWNFAEFEFTTLFHVSYETVFTRINGLWQFWVLNSSLKTNKS